MKNQRIGLVVVAVLLLATEIHLVFPEDEVVSSADLVYINLMLEKG